MVADVRKIGAISAPAIPALPGAGQWVGCSRWKLILRNVLRQRSRNLLLGALMLFASFVIVYFSQFLAGVERNFSRNLIALATGDVYVASEVTRQIDRDIFDREYEYFRLTPELLAELKRMPGFLSATPRLEFDAKVATEIDSVPFRTMAFDVTADSRIAANFRFAEGRMFASGAYEIIVPVDFARRNEIKVGDTIRLLAKAVNKKVNLIDYQVTGLFSTISLPAWFDNYVYIDLSVARVLVDDPAATTRVNISIDSASMIDGGLDPLSAVLTSSKQPDDPKLEASHWHTGAQMFAELTSAMQLSYVLVIGIITMMVGASLAFTTMLNIVERTKEIATLGALGATPGVIRSILVRENLMLALIASASGVILATIIFLITGKFGIPITNKELSGFLGSSHFYPALNAVGYVAGMLVPLVVALASSYFFALRASKRPIAEALADR